ncbi:ankyrin repeat, PH and SEC7 domain containing protein secG-like [Trichogramma pretiosum]|uniref:ankyrin repeat, PH and SEC7 domain containing protein secG-like n=1 Tax=Trichogramma pretiosum TaxID=7493 RepID=UPI000C718F10|nr:ankyrin repeat, PH and SEC7 domain containing protein secG-like [Trichogramma pretiosum]
MSNHESHVCECENTEPLGEVSLAKLEDLRRPNNWESLEERYEFLRNLHPLIDDWQGRFPNIRDVFRPEEIERLLCDSLTLTMVDVSTPGKLIISFIAFTGYRDEPTEINGDDKPSSRRTTLLHRSFMEGRIECVCELFEIYDRYDVNYADESGLTHLHVACWAGYKVAIQKFLEFGHSPNIVHPKFHSPLWIVLYYGDKEAAELLLRNGADPNIIDSKGWTPLHLVCKRNNDDDDEGLAEWFFKINDELNQLLRIDARDKKGRTPLHVALDYGKKKAIELLLRRGLDPNIVNEKGRTPLHQICSKYHDDDDDDDGHDGVVCNPYALAELFFRINDEKEQLVQMNVQDNYGNTPLHLAMEKPDRNLIELLLRRGADPKLVNEDGRTPLHIISISNDEDDDDDDYDYDNNALVELFLTINDEKQQMVKINAQDQEGYTSLHLALINGYKKLSEVLLKRGAGPNLANAEGSTPLHFVARVDVDGLAKLFFKVNDKLNQVVEIDPLDKLGRTPLQWAVAHAAPNNIDVILDRGADLSKFVFPTESHFEECFVNLRDGNIVKFEAASSLLACVESLQIRGYELDDSDVLKIMKLFAKYNFFEESSADLLQLLKDDKEFTSQAKEMKVRQPADDDDDDDDEKEKKEKIEIEEGPNPSLHDLLQLGPKEAEKIVTYDEYYKFARSNPFSGMSEKYQEVCALHLCEKVARGFFWRRAVYPLWDLIHRRLPIECCDMIIKSLTNKDLCNICLATNSKEKMD